MLISRTPLRISFVGGGSDLPSFYRRSKGAVLSTSITKYIYISVHPYFHKDKFLFKYSETEEVEDIESISHPLIRLACKYSHVNSGLEFSSAADVPAGTGLTKIGWDKAAQLEDNVRLEELKKAEQDNTQSAE